jgi:hypothetical protein
MSNLYLHTDSNKSRVLSAVGDADQARGMAHSIPSFKDVTLTAAQLDALAATAVELIAAPGAGKIIQFLGAQVFLDYGTATYAGSSETITFKYENGSGATVGTITEAFIESTADAYMWVNPISAVGLANKALIAIASADLTTGDSTMKMRLYYRIVTADLSAI